MIPLSEKGQKLNHSPYQWSFAEHLQRLCYIISNTGLKKVNLQIIVGHLLYLYLTYHPVHIHMERPIIFGEGCMFNSSQGQVCSFMSLQAGNLTFIPSSSVISCETFFRDFQCHLTNKSIFEIIDAKKTFETSLIFGHHCACWWPSTVRC